MKNYIGIIAWLVITVVIAFIFTDGYNKSNAERLKADYRCYLSLNGVDYKDSSHEQVGFTRAELESLQYGQEIYGAVVSRVKLESRTVDVYFDMVDNPKLTSSKMTCFE